MEKKDLIINREGQVEFYIYASDNDSIPSKSMNVFYNKKMEINRDVSNLAINTYKKQYNQKTLIIIDSMAASGVSSIRMLKECENIQKIYINDINPEAVNLIQQNLDLNKLNDNLAQIEISRKDANLLFSEIAQQPCMEQKVNFKPNIISIDPFGTPNLYMDTAFKAIQKQHGLLCVTATDTAVLFGVRPKACIRKYMAKPLHNEYCKEIGARILIYFLSRIANVNKLGILPLLTFYSNHFIRVFSLTFKDKKRISKNFQNYGYIIHCNHCGYRVSSQDNILELPNICPNCKKNEKLDYAGPLWVEKIHEEAFLKRVISFNEDSEYSNKKRINKILNLAIEELEMPISYYNIHKLTQKLKLSFVPKLEAIIKIIKEKGYHASRTHFDFLSIKTDMNINLIENSLLEILNGAEYKS